MPELLSQWVTCPYCGEGQDLWFDTTGGEQVYVEDCIVCCRPMECRLSGSEGGWQLEVRREDD